MIFLVVDQLGSSESIIFTQIPYARMTCNVEHSNITLSQHLNLPPWVWVKWPLCDYGIYPGFLNFSSLRQQAYF